MFKPKEILTQCAAWPGRLSGGLVAVAKSVRKRLPSKPVLVVGGILVWLLSGIFTIDTNELGVVYRFGKVLREADPGFHYHFPRPIERVKKGDVTRIRRYDIGHPLRAESETAPNRETTGGIILLTNDESLILTELVVHTKVDSVVDYLDHLNQPEDILRNGALSVLNTVVARTGFDSALTEGKGKMETQIQTDLQKLMNSYGSGLQVVSAKLKYLLPPAPVSEAFLDVSLAREEQRRVETEAKTYENKVLSKARADATRKVQTAEALSNDRIKRAQGDADRFLARLSAYQKDKTVTRKRLYLEAVEDIVGHASKVVVASEKQMIWSTLQPGNTPAPKALDALSPQEGE